MRVLEEAFLSGLAPRTADVPRRGFWLLGTGCRMMPSDADKPSAIGGRAGRFRPAHPSVARSIVNEVK